MRLLHGTTAWAVDRDGCSCPIDKQLLAGLVLLPQYHVLFPAPPLVQLAETGVAVAVGVGLPVLFPEQLLGQVCMTLALQVKIGKIRYRQHGRAATWWSPEQRGLKPARDLGRFGSLQILVSVPRSIEQLRAICRRPRRTSNFNRRTSLILRTDNLPARTRTSSSLGQPALVRASCACALAQKHAAMDTRHSTLAPSRYFVISRWRGPTGAYAIC